MKAKDVSGEFQVNACSIKNPAFGGGFHLILSESLPLRSAITINSLGCHSDGSIGSKDVSCGLKSAF
ncbi:MAG: hypothetical protein GY822_28885 [Deltaproteobacteria bacterium]|nr:hypothetical protein [Deltaproteobacteria bacterium]